MSVREYLVKSVEISNPRRRTIVVADDDPAMRRIIGIILRTGGYSPYMAKDGQECLQLLARVRPHAIMLDIKMPGMDGLSLCEEIKHKFPEIQCPVVFLTSATSPETIKLALKLGAKGFIAKPIKPADLLSRLEAILRANVLPPNE